MVKYNPIVVWLIFFSFAIKAPPTLPRPDLVKIIAIHLTSVTYFLGHGYFRQCQHP